MQGRRILLYSVAVLVATVAGYVVFITQPFAQAGVPGGAGVPMGPGAPGAGGMGGPGMGGPGMMGPGMMGPGMGGAAGGGAQSYQWTENEMPEELLMNYAEFLASEGQAPVPIPDVYLMDKNGNPKRYTRKMWYQLARVYRDHPPQLDREQIGTPGGKLWSTVHLEASVKIKEVNAIIKRWKAALGQFWFEVGYPRIGPQQLAYDWERKSIRNPDGTISWKRWEATLPDSFTITVPVVMHINEGCRESYARNFYKALKEFSHRGHGRSAFRFITYEGGMYKPHTFYLADEAIQVWNDLWDRVQVQLRLYDPENVQIAQALQASGLTAAIFTQMIHPPTIYYTPRYRLLLPPEDDKFHGGRLNLDGKRGWYYEFEFTLSREELKALDDAKARLVVNGGPPERMKYLQPPAQAGVAGAGPGAGMGAGAMGAGMPGQGPPSPAGPGAGEIGMGPMGPSSMGGPGMGPGG